MNYANKVFNNIVLFMFGAVTYNCLEILFRGRTHWTMGLVGGTCFAILCHIFIKIHRAPWWKKCFTGAVIITLLELIAGCIVNLWMDWNVWDYSGRRFQFLGQICLLFSIYWFALCIPVIWFSRIFRRLTSGDPPM
ncbi:MAG: putative ABC transporter permease [Anaerovoracaceae bacterium]